MNLPDFAKTKAFWEAVSIFVSGALALLAFFGKIDMSWAVPSAVVFAWISALLRMFGIQLELRYKALQNEVATLKRQLLDSGLAIPVKTAQAKKLRK